MMLVKGSAKTLVHLMAKELAEVLVKMLVAVLGVE